MKKNQLIIALFKISKFFGVLIVAASYLFYINNKKEIFEQDDLTYSLKSDGYDITFIMPVAWKNVSEQTNFDLQFGDGDSYFSIFAYRTIDLAENKTPKDVYELQNDDVMSKRDNVATISETEVIEHADKKITKKLYSAEKDGSKNYYYINLIELNNSDTFAWTMFTATPSYAERNLDEWDRIISSVEKAN